MWSVVVGPAGAILATLDRLGWSALSATQWKTPFCTVDLCWDSPALVGRLADLSTAQTLWQALAVTERRPELAKGALLRPLQKLLAGSASLLTGRGKTVLRSTVSNGQWPQERLHRAGLVASPLCRLCGGAVGDLGHRHWGCPATQEMRVLVELALCLQSLA